MFASIHASVLGGGVNSRVICRTYKSEPHPFVEGQSLVRFGFFGLRSEQLTSVKKFMREHQTQKHRMPKPPVPNVDPPIPFNRIAIIDMNADIFSEIQGTLKDHYVGVKITHYLSYARLLATLKKLHPAAPVVASPAGAAPPAAITAPAAAATSTSTPASAMPAPVAGSDGTVVDHEAAVIDENAPPPKAWSFGGPLVFQITAKDAALIKFESSVGPDELILGRARADWVSRPTDLLSGLDKLDSNELREMIDYAVSGGGRGRSFLKLRDLESRVFYVSAQSSLLRSAEGEVDAHVQVELKEIEKSDYEMHTAHLANDEATIKVEDLMYDAIYIDVNLIRGDLKPWFDGLHESFMRAGIVKPNQAMPKIILLADEKSTATPEKYRSKVVSDFMYKPLDRKVLSYKAKELIELVPRGEPELPPFVKCDLPAKLAKDAQMEELSEYGLSIAHPTPFKKGATVRFFSPIFGGGAEGVLARCTHCEERKVEKTVSYVCHFMYFGTPDEILKRIRNWIREEYIHQKEGGAS